MGEARGHHDDGVGVEMPCPPGESACGLYAGGVDGGHRGVGAHVDARLHDPRANAVSLHGVGGPLRHLRDRGDERDREALLREHLRDDGTEVVVVVVEQYDALAGGPCPGHDVVRSEDRCAGIDLDGMRVPATDAVASPRRPGRDHDVVEAELEDVVGAHRRFAIDLDVVETVELLQPIVDDANPCGQPGKLRLAGHTATEHPARLGERHGIPAITQCACGFEARRSRTDDEHRGVGAIHRDALRMPAASEFLSHCGVLRAPDRRHGEVAGHADVAADAFADVCEVAAFDLVGHEGIRDRRPCGADEVENA